MDKRILYIITTLICSPFFLCAQKEYDVNIPKDLQQYTLLVEEIPDTFLYAELNERDSSELAIEYKKIQYIQDLYLVKEPVFPCKLLAGNAIEQYFNSMPLKYRYVLKFKVVEKKINKEHVEVLAFYFRDLKKGDDFEMLEDHNYNTKATLVLVYGVIRKAYEVPKD